MAERAEDAADQISFGPFRLLPGQKLLLEGGVPVRLGSRARDILTALVQRPGQVIGKEALIAHVWPDTVVEEGNLKVHVAALRRALGDGQGGARYIANVPGRGYCFVAPVARSATTGVAAPAASPAARGRDLPHSLKRMVGRAEIVDTLVDQLPKHRFITIVGPGGIGKTSVALAGAERLIDSFRDGARFVDLAPLTNPLLVSSALASALDVPVRSEHPMQSVVSWLRDKQILIVLDSCEHVIDEAAAVAEEIFTGTAGAHVLATSREPLRVVGERVHRLPQLASPPAAPGLTAAEALRFPAVELFVERAAASLDAFEFGDAEAPIVADICRRLDGIALAIEIAAGRVDAFGVRGIAARLDDRFHLMMRGRRTALSRHQTLSTMLDWSYTLLPEVEQATLRRLAIFVGDFMMDSAVAVLKRSEVSAGEIIDSVANLIAKSLVTVGLDGRVAQYRLLDTTRAYALGKLEECAEREACARRHAEHYRDLLEKAESGWRHQPAAEWLEDHRHLIDNVRAALDWTFSESGDLQIGVGLTLAAVPLWFQLSLTSECYQRVKRALSGPAASRNAAQEMGLHAARAWSLMQTRGSIAETRAAWSAVLEIARELDDVDYQLRALWGLWAGLLNNSEFRSALALAEQFSELAARSHRADQLVGDRMVGYILHLLGDQSGARVLIERMIDQYVVPVIGAQIIRFIFDQKATARCFLARILWLQGFPDQARRTAYDIVDAALASGDTLSLCQSLVQAGCPVAIFVGDAEQLEKFVGILLDHSTRNGLEFWQAWGRCFAGVLSIKRGEVAEGLSRLNAALVELRAIEYGVYYIVFLGEYAEGLGRIGRAADGLVAIREAIARSERNEENWCRAELLRIEGELLLIDAGAGASAAAETQFRQAIDLARAQRTPAWELRTAISLARLRQSEGRMAEGRAILAPAFDRFTEGHSAGDLRAARSLLRELEAGIPAGPP